MDVDAYLTERAALLDRFLDGRLPPSSESTLAAAMRHLLLPGGKRLRPAFAFAACEAVAGPALGPEAALPAAAAVELLHTYSLVHDDLPCMDDDALRRGRPTVHVAFGEALAVLAGDALQAEAFAVLAEPGPSPVPAEVVLAATRDLARAAGARQLVGGQADDLECAREAPDVERVESIHRRKTAALIGAAVTLGARFGGADAARLARLERFGAAVGLGFQIADDRLDRDAGESCSYVGLVGEDAARARAEALLDEALAEIEDWGERAEPLRELARFAVRRDR